MLETDTPSAPRDTRTPRWSLRETTVLVAIGAVFAVLYLGWVQLWLVAQAAIGPLAMDLVFGFWFAAAIVAARVFMKPGAAFLAEVLAAGVQILLGSPAGLILLLTGAVQGAGAEAAYALGRWRRWGLGMALAAGAGAAVFSFAYTWIRFDYGALAPDLLLTMAVLRTVSGMVLGGLAGWFLTEALYRTGVLRGLPIDRVRRG